MGEPQASVLDGAREAISVTWWAPGHGPEPAGLDQAGGPDGTCWIDLDITQASAGAPELLELIGPLCGGQLEAEMLDDLLNCHRRSGDRSYGHGRGSPAGGGG